MPDLRDMPFDGGINFGTDLYIFGILYFLAHVLKQIYGR